MLTPSLSLDNSDSAFIFTFLCEGLSSPSDRTEPSVLPEHLQYWVLLSCLHFKVFFFLLRFELQEIKNQGLSLFEVLAL